MGDPRPLRRILPALLGAGGYALLAALVAACGSTAERYAGPDGPRRLYEARCGLCHVPYAPGDFTPQEWPSLVESMSARAGLTRTQRKRVLDYLVESASAPTTDV